MISSLRSPSPPPSATPSSFDPYSQNVTFLGPDGSTPISVPIPVIDSLNDETLGKTANAGAQVGAVIITLLALLALTPATKLRRPSALLHILGLVSLASRLLMAHDAFTPASHFYMTWSDDYDAVDDALRVQVFAGYLVNLALVAVVELALMHQAWTMVSLWPSPTKHVLACASVAFSLVAVGFCLAMTVALVKSDIESTPRVWFLWLQQATIVAYAVFIFWFCATFNAKLVLHLAASRGLLPSTRSLSSMELLVMTNGILMVIPAILTGLQWSNWLKFEPSSLTLVSVVIILPPGTLASQRMASQSQQVGSGGSDLLAVPNGGGSGVCSSSRDTTAHLPFRCAAATDDSKAPSSLSASSHTGSRHPSAGAEHGSSPRRVEDPFDLELLRTDSASLLVDAQPCGWQHEKG